MFSQYKDIIIVIVGALLVSTKGILLKFLYQEGVSVEASLLLRSAVSVPMIWLWACYKSSLNEVLNIPRNLIAGAMLAGVVCYYIAAWLDFVALTMIDAGLERVLLFSYPIIVVLARAIMVRKLPSLRVCSAVVLIYAGIILAVGGLDMSLWQKNDLGAMLVLLSACGFTYYLFANERYTRTASSASFIVWAISAASVALLIHFAIFNDPGELRISTKAWAYLLLMTAFTSVLPLFLFSEGIKRIGTERAAIVSTIGPPGAIVLAAYLLGETMSGIQIFGSALIIVGIIIVEYRTRSLRLDK